MPSRLFAAQRQTTAPVAATTVVAERAGLRQQARKASPGLREYVTFFLSDEVAGPDGPLADYGLVPDPKLHETQALVAAEEPMAPLSQ
jgi:hypothetical protein